MAYQRPQVLVYEEFSLVPAAITDPLRAHVSGPHAQLFRHDEPAERAQAALGAYDPTTDATYPWPGRAAGGVVDPGFTRLFLDSATLEYFADLIGADATVAPVANQPDQVQISGSGGFRANGVAYPRLAALYDRDVAPGDSVSLRGVVGGVEYTLDTYVRALKATPAAAVVGAAAADAGNAGTQAASAVVSQVVGTAGCNILNVDLSDYDARPDGALNDTYTIEVVAGSAGGDLAVAHLRITSASGLDDVPDVVSGEVDEPFTVGRRGLSLRWTCGASHESSTVSADDLVAGDSWTVVVHDDYTALQATAGGTYSGVADTTYIVTFTRGGAFDAASASDRPQFTVSTTTGVDVSGPTTVSATGTSYPVGTRGTTFQLAAGPAGARKGDQFYIAVTAAVDGVFNILQLGHNLPAALRTATDLDLRLAIAADIEVPRDRAGFDPLLNWDQSATQVSVYAGMIAYDPSYTSGGVPMPIAVKGGRLSVEYRAWLPTLAGGVGTISDVSQLDALISGPLDPANPLKWGVFEALSNANGTDVKFTAVADPSQLSSWSDVLARLVGREDVYGLVPLSTDPAVIALYRAHVAAQSSPQAGRWRVLWTQLTVVDARAAVSAATSTDGGVVLATIADDPTTAGTQYTYLEVPASNADFADHVVAGDVVRALYSTSFGVETYTEFVVDAVLNQNALRLVSGPDAAVTVPRKIEVWHPLSKDEQAAALAAQAAAYGDRRVRAVWPDTAAIGGTAMPGYYVCCMLAGQRSGIVPHQPMTNLPLAGLDDVSRASSYFNNDQLDTIAGGGGWIVTMTPSGTILTRHALTTDMTDVNSREEMVVANVDSIAYFYRRSLEGFIGKMNVTPSALSLLNNALVSAGEFLKSNGFTPTLGAQLIDVTFTPARRHATLADRVVVTLNLTVPAPINNIECHLVI